jgi:hypothetical protein
MGRSGRAFEGRRAAERTPRRGFAKVGGRRGRGEGKEGRGGAPGVAPDWGGRNRSVGVQRIPRTAWAGTGKVARRQERRSRLEVGQVGDDLQIRQGGKPVPLRGQDHIVSTTRPHFAREGCGANNEHQEYSQSSQGQTS